MSAGLRCSCQPDCCMVHSPVLVRDTISSHRIEVKLSLRAVIFSSISDRCINWALMLLCTAR